MTILAIFTVTFVGRMDFASLLARPIALRRKWCMRVRRDLWQWLLITVLALCIICCMLLHVVGSVHLQWTSIVCC